MSYDIFQFTKWDFVYSRFKKDTTTSKMSEQDQPENTFSSSNGIMRNILYVLSSDKASDLVIKR